MYAIPDKYDNTQKRETKMAKEKNKEKKPAEEIKEAAAETVEEAADKIEKAEEAVEEAAEKASEAADKVEETKEPAQLASTEAKRKKKAERREAKAARKEANKVEEKKKRPNNAVLTILIFGVLIGMFVFVGAYNYFSRPATIEKYMTDNGIAEMYKEVAFSEHTKMTMTAEKNAINVLFKVDEDAPEDELENYTGEDGTKTIKEWGAYFLTSMKPQTQALNAKVKVTVEQGDEELNSAELTYREAKKVLKDAEKEAEEEAEKAEDADDAEDADEAETDD